MLINQFQVVIMQKMNTTFLKTNSWLTLAICFQLVLKMWH